MKRKKGVLLTGARSDYGIARPLVQALSRDQHLEFGVVAHGMHLDETYGNSISEVRSDGHAFVRELRTLRASANKTEEFSTTVEAVFQCLHNIRPSVAVVIGDRLEALAGAFAAHFARVPLVHIGGGHLTEGSEDNYYRFAISILADVNLTTSKLAAVRLKQIPTIPEDTVHFVGSMAISGIKAFLRQPFPLSTVIPGLNQPFALMSFHPEIDGAERVTQLLKKAVERITQNGLDVVVTAPNNDRGSAEIIRTIKGLARHPEVHYLPHLGVPDFYSAIYSSEFVIGNSSSGVMEAPYFRKPVIDVGSRQSGREKDVGIKSVGFDEAALVDMVDQLCTGYVPRPPCSKLFGDGSAVSKTREWVVRVAQSNR